MKLSTSSFRKTGYIYIHSAAAYNQLITGVLFNLLHFTSFSSSQSLCCRQTLKWFSSLLQSAVISGFHAAARLFPIHLLSSYPVPGELIHRPHHIPSSSHLLIKSRSSASSPVSRPRGGSLYTYGCISPFRYTISGSGSNRQRLNIYHMLSCVNKCSNKMKSLQIEISCVEINNCSSK